MKEDDIVAAWSERVRAATAAEQPIRIRGGGTKDWYGQSLQGEFLDTPAHRGIIAYDPAELVVTARAGTPLLEIEAALAEHDQMLAFEPPHFGPQATLGGCIAAGIAGPRRQAAGAPRDFVLGAVVMNGHGQVLHFGGQVVKNVAGYDVSRLMAGSLGTLALILELSIKVLPRPKAEITLKFDMNGTDAVRKLNEWGGRPLPISASAWWNDTLVLRLSGARAAVEAAAHTLGGERIEAAAAAGLWRHLRDQSDDYFLQAREAVAAGGALWRLSVPSTMAPLSLPGKTLIEWGGAQRWLVGPATAGAVRDAAQRAGGHATLFRAHDKAGGVFAPLQSPLDRIHRELKKAFDPAGLYNPGRLYPGL